MLDVLILLLVGLSLDSGRRRRCIKTRWITLPSHLNCCVCSEEYLGLMEMLRMWPYRGGWVLEFWGVAERCYGKYLFLWGKNKGKVARDVSAHLRHTGFLDLSVVGRVHHPGGQSSVKSAITTVYLLQVFQDTRLSLSPKWRMNSWMRCAPIAWTGKSNPTTRISRQAC